MKIKVGKKIIDSQVEPVMILFESEEEKIFHIKALLDMDGRRGQLGYAIFPNDYPQNKLKKFLEVPGISEEPKNDTQS